MKVRLFVGEHGDMMYLGFLSDSLRAKRLEDKQFVADSPEAVPPVLLSLATFSGDPSEIGGAALVKRGGRITAETIRGGELSIVRGEHVIAGEWPSSSKDIALSEFLVQSWHSGAESVLFRSDTKTQFNRVVEILDKSELDGPDESAREFVELIIGEDLDRESLIEECGEAPVDLSREAEWKAAIDQFRSLDRDSIIGNARFLSASHRLGSEPLFAVQSGPILFCTTGTDNEIAIRLPDSSHVAKAVRDAMLADHPQVFFAMGK